MNKQNVVSRYSAVLFSHKDELNSDVCSKMGEPWKHAAYDNSGTNGQILYDSTYMRYLEEADPWR